MSQMQREMKELVERVEDLRKRFNKIPVRIPVGGGLLLIRPLVIRSVALDHLITRSYDFATAVVGDTDILVALDWLLRRSPFDGNIIAGIEYTYTTNIERLADDTVTTETQVIVPNFQGAASPYDGDIIFAASGIQGGTGVTVSGQPLALLDLNVSGRAWARKFE